VRKVLMNSGLLVAGLIAPRHHTYGLLMWVNSPLGLLQYKKGQA
jgi:hypothetical protein